MSSSAKQRLWATCLGIAVGPKTTAEQVSASIDEYQSKKQWKSKATREQKRLAEQMGVDISGTANRRETAGNLYDVGLLYGWVFSVWRRETQQKGGWYSELGLPANPAMDIAVELYQAGHASEVKGYSTTDTHAGDVFFVLRGKAAKGAAYPAAVSQLSPILRGWSKQPTSSARREATQTTSPSRKGWGLLVIGLVMLWLLSTFSSSDAVRVPPNSTDGVELTNEYEEVGVSDLQEDQQEVRVVSEATAGPEKIAAQELVAPESKPETSRVLLTDYVETTTTDDRGKAKSRQLNEASKAEKARLEKVYDEKAMRRAGSCIAMTKQLIQTGKAGEPQAKWMREVVADFPDSELATQAAVLLEQIPQ